MGHTGTGPYGSSNDRRDPIGTPPKELPCYYCTSPAFKGWSEGKCPYCGKPEPWNEEATAAAELQSKFNFVRQNSPTVATSYRLFEDNEIMALKRAVVGLFESNQLLIEQVAAWKQRF